MARVFSKIKNTKEMTFAQSLRKYAKEADKIGLPPIEYYLCIRGNDVYFVPRPNHQKQSAAKKLLTTPIWKVKTLIED